MGVDRSRAGKRVGGERGIALILTLLVLAILIILITQFAWSAKVDRTIARNAKDDMKMLFAARGSLAFVRAHLRADRINSPKLDSRREDWYDPQAAFPGEPAPYTLQIGEDAADAVDIEVRIVDCESFFNVNLLYTKQIRDAFAKGTLLRLAQNLEVEEAEQVVERITDYIDEDGEGQYEGGARNQPLTFPEELLALAQEGSDGYEIVKRGLLGIPDDQQSGTVGKRGLLEFLTTNGSTRINLNTAKIEVLKGLIPAALPTGASIDVVTAVQAIEDQRTGASTGGSSPAPPPPAPSSGASVQRPGKDFEKVEDLNSVPNAGLNGLVGPPPPPPTPGATPPPSFRRFIDILSTDFRLRITASRAGLRKDYEVILRRGRETFDVISWREIQPQQTLASTGATTP